MKTTLGLCVPRSSASLHSELTQRYRTSRFTARSMNVRALAVCELRLRKYTNWLYRELMSSAAAALRRLPWSTNSSLKCLVDGEAYVCAC